MQIFRYNILLLALVFATCVNAQQTDRDCIRQGNRYFLLGEMDKAVTFYQKAIEKKPSVEAYFNLGCASSDSTTLDAYLNAEALSFDNPRKRAMNFHNMGWVWYMYALQKMRSNDSNTSKYFENAVNNYKSALRCNPSDNETRYNLAMAQWMLKKSKEGGSQQQQQQQDQDKQQQQQQEQQKKEQKEDKKDEMSDEVIEQLLRSAQQNEKETKDKVKVQPNSRRSLTKDW